MDTLISFLMLADEAAEPLRAWHLGLVGLSGAGAIGGSILAGVKWFGRHVDQISNERLAEREADAKAAARLAEERASERVRDAAVIERQHSTFLEAIDKRDIAFAAVIARRDEDCAKERALDRAARAHELRLVFRLTGLPDPGDTGKFKAPG